MEHGQLSVANGLVLRLRSALDSQLGSQLKVELLKQRCGPLQLFKATPMG